MKEKSSVPVYSLKEKGFKGNKVPSSGVFK